MIQTLDNSKSAKDLMSLYMDYVTQLMGDTISIEDFCKYAEIEESNFFDCYSSEKSIEQEIWRYIASDAIETITQDPQYVSFGQDEQLLSYFYTFFESLTLNQEYFAAHLALRHSFVDKKDVLKEMKKVFFNYIQDTIASNALSGIGVDQIDLVNDVMQRGQKEGFWLQFICLIDFWNKDTSEGKEKTDIAIEKSVRAAIDLVEIAPVRSLLDLGRFIWQERRNSN